MEDVIGAAEFCNNFCWQTGVMRNCVSGFGTRSCYQPVLVPLGVGINLVRGKSVTVDGNYKLLSLKIRAILCCGGSAVAIIISHHHHLRDATRRHVGNDAAVPAVYLSVLS
ncbi:MAG: hypothetical protein ABSD89_00465 [Halobacteriota archaeon]